LFNQGVRYASGIPGGPSIPYLEAFKGAGIEFILTSNEASAGIMVDVTSRLTGIYGTLLYQGDLFCSDIFLVIKVLRADSIESMRKAIIEALSVNEPIIINAVIDPEDYKWLIVRR
jgi:thiamine pyrophosphate-dependent acetolactate synthase large subunit-like protein